MVSDCRQQWTLVQVSEMAHFVLAPREASPAVGVPQSKIGQKYLIYQVLTVYYYWR